MGARARLLYLLYGGRGELTPGEPAPIKSLHQIGSIAYDKSCWDPGGGAHNRRFL